MNEILIKIKEKFSDKDLFDQALTHRSWVNEHPGLRQTNERLEFLGDAVLEFVVSSYIYSKLPDKEEGFLTAVRANIVNTKNLALLSENLSLGESIFLSKGEEAGGGRSNQSLLADTLEALIGALYLDQGFEAAQEFIHEQLLEDLEGMLAKPLKDPKSRLQETVQSRGRNTPKYKVVSESGPDHAKEFLVEVSVDGEKLGEGKGKSKNSAEQEAASSALANLGQLD